MTWTFRRSIPTPSTICATKRPDVVYHLFVLLERYGIDLDEFAAELNNRMTDEERLCGGVRLHEAFAVGGK